MAQADRPLVEPPLMRSRKGGQIASMGSMEPEPMNIRYVTITIWQFTMAKWIPAK